jgi:S-adenosylmethionine:tRNA ribosyltransferase-isomerase
MTQHSSTIDDPLRIVGKVVEMTDPTQSPVLGRTEAAQGEGAMKPDDLDLPMPARFDGAEPIHGEDECDARMAVFEKATGHVHLGELPELVKFLEPGDLLVFNNSRVARSRFFGKIRSAHVLVQLRGFIDGSEWAATVDAVCQVRPGNRIVADGLEIDVLRSAPSGGTSPLWIIRFRCDESAMDRFLDCTPAIGTAPSQKTSPSRSVSLPTAGSVFSPTLLDDLRDNGTNVAAVTLHTGLPGFEKSIIDEESVDEHRVPGERYSISAEAACQINEAVAAGRRVVAVGTTVLRAIETAALRGLPLAPRSEWTELGIYPGFASRVCDSLMTGFHPARSSHLALAMAFTGRDLLYRGYAAAVQAGYRFSYRNEITLTLGR